MGNGIKRKDHENNLPVFIKRGLKTIPNNQRGDNTMGEKPAMNLIRELEIKVGIQEREKDNPDQHPKI